MHRTLTIVKFVAILVAATTVTSVSVTIAAMLVVSRSLPYTTGPNLAYTRELHAVAEPASFGTPTAVPAGILANSDGRNAEMQRVSFTMPADVPAEFSGVSRALTTVTKPASAGSRVAMPVPRVPLPVRRPASSDRPVVTPMPPVRLAVRRHVNARPIAPDPPSASPAVISGLPRRLETNFGRISFNTPSLAPMAFIRFCLRYPQDCKVRGINFRPELVSLTNMRRAELVAVNRDVNRAITPYDKTNDVSAEEWLVSPREGDCKDYAVTKRHELLARGWPSSSLLLTEVVVESGEHHLVLVVRTREDDLVLDNLNENVRPVLQVPYRWVRAQQVNNPKFWSLIDVTRATRMAMNVH